MLKAGKVRPPTRNEPLVIRWGDKWIQTSDAWQVPKSGVVRGEILSVRGDPDQGFDIKVDGWLKLSGGERVGTLRTWNDDRYEPSVEYRFHSDDGILRVWNVYKMRYPGGQVVQERWTENAGMWVERISEDQRVYHCSPGMASPPDFESLVFRVSVRALSLVQ